MKRIRLSVKTRNPYLLLADAHRKIKIVPTKVNGNEYICKGFIVFFLLLNPNRYGVLLR